MKAMVSLCLQIVSTSKHQQFVASWNLCCRIRDPATQQPNRNTTLFARIMHEPAVHGYFKRIRTVVIGSYRRIISDVAFFWSVHPIGLSASTRNSVSWFCLKLV